MRIIARRNENALRIISITLFWFQFFGIHTGVSVSVCVCVCSVQMTNHFKHIQIPSQLFDVSDPILSPYGFCLYFVLFGPFVYLSRTWYERIANNALICMYSWIWLAFSTCGGLISPRNKSLFFQFCEKKIQKCSLVIKTTIVFIVYMVMIFQTRNYSLRCNRFNGKIPHFKRNKIVLVC